MSESTIKAAREFIRSHYPNAPSLQGAHYAMGAFAQKVADEQTSKMRDTLEVLKLYRDICIECCMYRSNHDENGQVDMMDECGMMICGNPKYPADEALKELEETTKNE